MLGRCCVEWAIHRAHRPLRLQLRHLLLRLPPQHLLLQPRLLLRLQRLRRRPKQPRVLWLAWYFRRLCVV